jgi:CheY-like chemotaxis protein
VTKARIIIVEDEAIVVAELRDTLKRLGYEVPAVAFSGEEAMAKVRELRPDIVLMNIDVQGEMDGIEAAENIREWGDIPIVYFTGYMDERRIMRAKRTAPFTYIMKPYEENELVSSIERLLHT